MVWAAPQTIFKRAHSRSPLNIYWWGKEEGLLLSWGWTPYPPIQRATQSPSPQYKELYAIYLALKEVKGPLNLFSDSVHAVNLLLWLSRSFIKLDANPLFPLLIQVSTLLQERDFPIYIQYVWLQSSLPGPISEGNTLADQTPSTGTFMASTEQADQFHSHTHKYKGASSPLPPHPSCSTPEVNKHMFLLCIHHYQPSFIDDEH